MKFRKALELLAGAPIVASTLLGCKPTPEKICDHEVEISQLVPMRGCLERVSDLSKRSPNRFASYAACSKGAKNVASLGSCTEELDKQLASDVTVELTASSLSVNGKTISQNPTLAEFEGILGKDHSTSEGDDTHNTGHAWESYGVHASTPVGKDVVTELSVWFQPPRGTSFSGKLSVDGKAVDKASSAATMKTIPRVKDGPFGSSLTVDFRGLDTFILMGKNERITFISIRFTK